MHPRVASALRILPLALLLVAPSGLAAQGGLTLASSLASWDLSGVGTGTTLAFRWDRVLADPPALGPLSIEAGLGWFQDGRNGQGAVDLLLVEAGVRFALPGPFHLGLGPGWAIGLEDRSGDDLTLWAALAADLGVGADWSLRPELGVRSVDPWAVTIVDCGLRLRRRLD